MRGRIPQRIFFRIKPIKMLVSLRSGPKYATLLSKEVDCTYSHCVKILEQFKNLGLVEFEKKGRIKIVKLTDFGQEIASTIDNIYSKLGKTKS